MASRLYGLRYGIPLLVALFAVSPTASGVLLIEVFGRERLADPGWPSGVLEVANLKTRYGGTIGPPFGSGCYTLNYNGNTAQLQETLRLFARIDVPGLGVILEDTTPPAGEGPPRTWSMVAWVPGCWHDLHNAPHSAHRPLLRAKPAPAPRLTVHLGSSAVDWSEVQVPAGVHVWDRRKRVEGRVTTTELRGRVLDVGTGKGVSGASISVIGRLRDEAVIVGESRADGRFSVSVMPNEYWVDVQAVGHAWRRVSVEVFRNPVAELSVTLAPTGHLRGRIVDPDGDPVVGARVRLVLSLGPDGEAYVPPENPTVVTDPSGRFDLEPLPEGYVRFIVFSDAGRLARDELRKFHRVFPESMPEARRDAYADFWPREVELRLERQE